MTSASLTAMRARKGGRGTYSLRLSRFANVPAPASDLAIAAQYHSFVTVDYEKAVESFTEWIQSYPNDEKAVNNFGSLYGDVCRYEQAIAKFMEARRMDPGDVIPQENLVELLPAIGKFDEGRATYEQMLRNGLDDDTPHVNMFSIAFHQNDEKEMARQIAWFDEKPNLRHEILSEEADAAAYGGHLARAHELTQQAVQSALAVGNKEQAAVWLLNAAWREQLFGNLQRAHDDALRALKIAPNSREGEAVAAILLARMGDFAKSKALMNDLEKRYSNHSVVQSYWLPSIRAQIALQKNDTAAALNELQTAAPLDTLYPQVMFYSHMPSVVLRAEAYSRSGQFALAAVEWSKVLDNPGIVQLSATAPMARLQLARSYVSQAALGDSSARAKARAAYKEFLALWQDADVGIHVLTEARSEYSKLQ